MSSFFSRIFRLRPGEAGLVVALGFMLLANSLALEVSGVVAVSGFLDQVSVDNIIIVWAVDMLLIAVATGLQSLVIDRFERVNILKTMLFGFALIYVVLRLMFTLNVPEWLNYSLLFVISDLQWLFFPLVFYILINDTFDMAQSKRLIPVIAAWGFAGQILGFGLAAVAPDILVAVNAHSADLLTLNVLIYLICYAVAMFSLAKIKVRQTTPRAESISETLGEGWGFVKEVVSFRYLMIALLCGYMVITILDFHFLNISHVAYGSTSAFQTFYSLYGLSVTTAGFIVQGLLSSRILDKLTVKNSFLVMPIALVLGSGAALGFPGLIAGTAAIFVGRLTQETINLSAEKAFQALVPEERRGRVVLFMSSYVFAGGTLLGCMALGIVVFLGLQLFGLAELAISLIIALAAAIVAIWAVFRMRAAYDSSMLNWRLKRRQRGSSVLDGIEF